MGSGRREGEAGGCEFLDWVGVGEREVLRMRFRFGFGLYLLGVVIFF